MYPDIKHIIDQLVGGTPHDRASAAPEMPRGPLDFAYIVLYLI
jgi:hypothetical protein